MKIKNLIFYPFRFIKKFLIFINTEINEYKNPYNKRYASLRNSYKACSFKKNRKEYIKFLNKVLNELGLKKYDESEGMYSEHLIIFSAIAIHNKNIKNILEIGTHNGQTACILSKLFPSAKITTIDLKDTNPLFKRSYKRDKNLKSFIKNRNRKIQNHENIQFIQMNSLELSVESGKLPLQDLIWVDGAHGYPVVSSDITNSIKLMHKNTFLMCDDIWKKTKRNDSLYESKGGYETLSYFADANIIKTHYFRKRINKPYNGNYKYVSLSKLI